MFAQNFQFKNVDWTHEFITALSPNFTKMTVLKKKIFKEDEIKTLIQTYTLVKDFI